MATDTTKRFETPPQNVDQAFKIIHKDQESINSFCLNEVN